MQQEDTEGRLQRQLGQPRFARLIRARSRKTYLTVFIHKDPIRLRLFRRLTGTLKSLNLIGVPGTAGRPSASGPSTTRPTSVYQVVAELQLLCRVTLERSHSGSGSAPWRMPNGVK